jgi:hypothetical protein
MLVRIILTFLISTLWLSFAAAGAPCEADGKYGQCLVYDPNPAWCAGHFVDSHSCDSSGGLAAGVPHLPI